MITRLTVSEDLPISVEDLRQHMRISHEEDDLLLEQALRAAVDYFETETRRFLTPTEIVVWSECWSWATTVMVAPIREVTGVVYVDSTGAEQSVSSSLWSWSRVPLGAELRLSREFSWPTLVEYRRERVGVQLSVGYSLSGESDSPGDPELRLPPLIRSAVLMLAAHYYSSPEAAAEKSLSSVVFSTQAVLDKFRVYA